LASVAKEFTRCHHLFQTLETQTLPGGHLHHPKHLRPCCDLIKLIRPPPVLEQIPGPALATTPRINTGIPRILNRHDGFRPTRPSRSVSLSSNSPSASANILSNPHLLGVSCLQSRRFNPPSQRHGYA